MYLPAITIGYAVPSENFTASVHSAFQSAINLLPSGKSKLLTLVTSGEADLPQGIRVDTPDGFSFEKFQTGKPATCRDGNLRIDSLTVQLQGARRWKCDLPRLEADTTNPTVSAAWGSVWETLNKRQKFSNSEIVVEELFHPDESARNLVSRKARAAIQDLINATRQYDLTNLSSVGSLTGLGSGLTPSGDDLLVGYLTGLWCTVQNRSERMGFVSEFGDTIIQLLSKTNDISRTYLYHAAKGQVSSRLADLAEAICRGQNPERLHEVAEAAMSVGHTSGMDTVTGLLIGLAVWDGDHLLHNRNEFLSQ